MRRLGRSQALAVPRVKRQTEPLALPNSNAVRVSLLGAVPTDGPLLGVGIREQQQVRDVLILCSALLRKVVVPTQQLKYGTDQVPLRSL